MAVWGVVLSALLSSVLLASAIDPFACPEGSCSTLPEPTQAHALIQSRTKTKAKKALNNKVASLLETVEKMGKDYSSGKLPPAMKEAVESFRVVVQDSLLPELHDAHDEGQKELNVLVQAVENTNTNSTSRLVSIKSTETLVGTARTNHTTCRTAEGVAAAAHKEACDDLKSFKDSIVAPAQKPATESGEEWSHYITTMTAYWSTKQALYDRKAGACTNGTETATKKKEECNHAQSQFELDFCHWRTQLLDACATSSSGYDSAKAQFDTKKASVEALVPQWESEYSAIKKIDCFLNTWLEPDKNHKDKLDECKQLTVDTSSMNITFPAVPSKAACDSSAVADHPGSSGFEPKEYASLGADAQAVTSCPGEQ